MIFKLALALLALGVLLGGTIWRLGSKKLKAGWRPSAAVMSVLLVAAALFLGFKSLWWEAAGAALLGLWLGLTAKRMSGGTRPRPAPAPPVQPGAMTRRDAASLLGVPENADAAAVKKAYLRLIRMAHPDAGGTEGLAVQLNRARDVLLGG
jgi:hypothetical protein